LSTSTRGFSSTATANAALLAPLASARVKGTCGAATFTHHASVAAGVHGAGGTFGDEAPPNTNGSSYADPMSRETPGPFVTSLPLGLYALPA
jgi:hypothetical protein